MPATPAATPGATPATATATVDAALAALDSGTRDGIAEAARILLPLASSCVPSPERARARFILAERFGCEVTCESAADDAPAAGDDAGAEDDEEAGAPLLRPRHRFH